MLPRIDSIQWYCCFVALKTVESLIFKSKTTSTANPQEFLQFFFRTVLTCLLRQQLELDFAVLRDTDDSIQSLGSTKSFTGSEYSEIKYSEKTQTINCLEFCSCD